MERRGCFEPCATPHITWLKHIKQRFSSDERWSRFLPSGRLKWQNRAQMGENYRPLSANFKGFLLSSLPFRQGLNWSKIIAVMSKGNLPQTEAGSSEAVAPGKAELLSFLKCQRGTGTGNTSALCALWFPLQRWQAAVLNKGNKHNIVIHSLTHTCLKFRISQPILIVSFFCGFIFFLFCW